MNRFKIPLSKQRSWIKEEAEEIELIIFGYNLKCQSSFREISHQNTLKYSFMNHRLLIDQTTDKLLWQTVVFIIWLQRIKKCLLQNNSPAEKKSKSD